MNNPYEGFGYSEEEITLLMIHDTFETLHSFYGGPEDNPSWNCVECGDTEEGLMHNNTWRNVEPLMGEQ